MNYLFIVIDDGELECFVIKRIIDLAFPNFNSITFRNAKNALENIGNKSLGLDADIIIILLDLNMPIMNGFQFLEEFDKLPLEIKDIYNINVLSSTKNQNDINKLVNYKFVNSFIEKPFNKEKLLFLMNSIQN